MSRVTFRPVTRLLAVVAGVLAFSGSARADSLPLYALGGDGVTVLATGTVSVQQLSSTQAAITLSLTNTNPAGGAITGFGFTGPNASLLGQVLAVTSFTSQGAPGGNANFGLLTGAQVNAALGNVTSLGTSLGAAVSGTGQGLTAGESGTFVLDVLGLGVGGLTAASLVDGGALDAQLRLGLTADLNLPTLTPLVCDPCPPGYCPPTPQPNGVPAPPSVVLAGLGLGGLLMGRFRRMIGSRANAAC